MNDPGFLQNLSLDQRARHARTKLRTWYLQHARDLPWRNDSTIYGIWLSEIMLQQTRVDTGIPKWKAFLRSFPDVRTLANATEDDVMKAWEGLGYYRRARLLHKAAKSIDSRGTFPTTYRQWLDVPGVGPYTAAAIASIALNEPVAAVDGNVNRVISRWACVTLPVDSSKGQQAIQNTADILLNQSHPGDHNQAMMELGATICSPKNPSCEKCPIAESCLSSHQESIWSTLPSKQPKRKPTEWHLQWNVATWQHWVVVVRQDEQDVWPNLWALPQLVPDDSFVAIGALFDPVKHVLTHRKIFATFVAFQAPSQQALHEYARNAGGQVMTWDEFEQLARPRLLTKHWDEIRAHFNV